MAETEGLAADFVTILSSELIAEVVEAYFNSEMYKVPVKVVDLKPTSDGYAFSLAFDKARGVVERQKETVTELKVVESGSKRSKNGRFTATKE